MNNIYYYMCVCIRGAGWPNGRRSKAHAQVLYLKKKKDKTLYLIYL